MKKSISQYQATFGGRRCRSGLTLLIYLMFIPSFIKGQQLPQPVSKDNPAPKKEEMILCRGMRVDRKADLSATYHPVILIELSSERLFDGRNQIHSLRIGRHEFNGRNGTRFELTPREFARTKTGDEVVVRYGATDPIEEKLLQDWHFGRLDKTEVDRRPIKTFEGTSIGDTPSYSKDGKLLHAGPPIKIRSRTRDTRTNIPIISVADENMFPQHWVSSPIDAHATRLSKSQLKRSIYILDVAMSKYRILFLRQNIKAIYLLNSLRLYGLSADASHSEDSIYVVNTGSKEYTDEYLESLFHQALSDLLLQKNNTVREPGKWDMPRFAPERTSWQLPSADAQMKLVYESNEDGPGYIYALENTGFTGVTLLKQFSEPAPDSAITCPLRCQQINPRASAPLPQAIKDHGFVYPRTVSEDLPVWSHDRKQIAFRSNRDSDAAELYLMQVDGSNARRLSYTRHVEKLSSMVAATCWSPDDRRLAYVLQDEFGSNLFVVNSDGTGQKKLPILSGKPNGIDGEGLSVDSVDRLIGWLPDGRILVVTERFFGGRTLYSILPDGTGQTALTEKGQVVGDALLSPDKTLIAIKTVGGLIVKDLKTNFVRYSARPEGVYVAAWSPDSKKLAYSAHGVFILDLETLSGVSVPVSANKPNYSRIGPLVSELVWSPDGKKIAYSMAFDVGLNRPSRNELWVVNADGSGSRQLTTETQMPMWSPNGRYIIFSRPQARLYLIKADGSGERYIAKGVYPQWIP